MGLTVTASDARGQEMTGLLHRPTVISALTVVANEPVSSIASRPGGSKTGQRERHDIRAGAQVENPSRNSPTAAVFACIRDLHRCDVLSVVPACGHVRQRADTAEPSECEIPPRLGIRRGSIRATAQGITSERVSRTHSGTIPPTTSNRRRPTAAAIITTTSAKRTNTQPGRGSAPTRCPSHFTQDVSIGWTATADGPRPSSRFSQCREPVEQGPSVVKGEHDGAGAGTRVRACSRSQ